MVGNPYNNSGPGAEAGEVYIYFSPLEGKFTTSINYDIKITGNSNAQNLGFSGAYLSDVFTGTTGGEIALGGPGNSSGNGVVYARVKSVVKRVSVSRR